MVAELHDLQEFHLQDEEFLHYIDMRKQGFFFFCPADFNRFFQYFFHVGLFLEKKEF